MASRPGWDFVDEGTIDPFDHARLDEEWLSLRRIGVRAGTLSRESLSVGVSQKDELPSLQAARRMGIPLVRRSTGGSGVLLSSQDLVWSLVVPRSHPIAAPPVTAAYARLGMGVTDFLRRHHLVASWGDPLDLSEEFCPLGARGSPLLVHGQAIGGAAQHLTASLLLHHGFLFYHHDVARLARLFDLPLSTLSERVSSLSALGVKESGVSLATSLLDSLRKWLERC
jgi:lipoate-protein ligase A